jgi:3-isopropylmalate/(R)-2-methylmalate dehydratase small subunit
VKALREVTGVTAVLDRPDVDTDQIIPKQFLKRIERTGYGEFLFFDWAKDPEFELHKPEYAGAKILVAGRNFGCGSSREHAAWALQQYGFDVVIAPSFGDIFRQNSLNIGLVPVKIDEARELVAFGGQELTVDLELMEIRTLDGRAIPFALGEHERHCIMEGLDEIALTQRHEDEIAAYEARTTAPIDTLSLQAG